MEESQAARAMFRAEKSLHVSTHGGVSSASLRPQGAGHFETPVRVAVTGEEVATYVSVRRGVDDNAKTWAGQEHLAPPHLLGNSA